MGICLDTERRNDESPTFEESEDTWTQNTPTHNAITTTERNPIPNTTNVHFETPKVPVIFILGGPGSGKVTHCDNLMQEKKGITHINMTDLLQQYAIGSEIQDFSILSSKTVTEVLMLEMKMSPNSKTFLVSGFPLNMRDVVEYNDKIKIITGVILISWRQKVLERQIDYGAKLGQVVLSLARMELSNFYRNVTPVVDYFDHRNMLISINGERHPEDVYRDFKAAVFKILGTQDNPPVFNNGTITNVPMDVTNELPSMLTAPAIADSNPLTDPPVENERPKTRVIAVNKNKMMKSEYPPVIWVIGGPGSNKASLCSQASKETGWVSVSIGKLLRSTAESTNDKPNSEIIVIKECISNGDLVPLSNIMKLVENQLVKNLDSRGIILDGFPRDMAQATEFEAKFKQKPTTILLDCSKLQLGRGRLDDSVTAFRRRLEIFRQASLPMLKAMDNIGRLTIVDGDTDTPPVQKDFINVIKDLIKYIEENQPPQGIKEPNEVVANGHGPVKSNTLESNNNNNNNPNLNKMTNGLSNGMMNGHVGNARQVHNEINYMDGHI